MVQLVAAYFFTGLVFLVVDLVWLSKIARGFYVEQIDDLLLDKPNLVAAGIFYLLYILGIMIFAVVPALKSGSAQYALVYGAMFGFFAYATYDMTNLATLKNWSLSMVMVDVAWGAFLTGISAWGGFYGARIISSS